MNQEIIIRQACPGDDSAVKKVAQSLDVGEYFFAYLSYKTQRNSSLVAVLNEQIVGCVVLKFFTVGKKDKMGLIDWIFVDRNFRGIGASKKLADAAIAHFQKSERDTCFALVDRYNSPAWNMLVHRGFAPFEIDEQFRWSGRKTLSLWIKLSLYFAPGHFILRKVIKEDTVSEDGVPGKAEVTGGFGKLSHSIIAWLGISLIFLPLFYTSMRGGIPLIAIPYLFAVVGISIFLHELSHKLAANRLGLKTVFKAWESGLLFGSLLILLGGGRMFYPAYGSTFIAKKDWAYHKDLAQTGLIYVTGPLASLLLASIFLVLELASNNGLLMMISEIGFLANYFIAAVNLIPVYPFAIFDGRKIFLWNKAVWLLLVAWTVILISAKLAW
ncbi:MAG TPA: GNAT family N-acetyltransferase [Candidatus Limnocylindrales bacterium]|nr:GNAT family N-acetyltransferase [Candidatus Limnocylindrales bacterium]